MQEPTTFFSRYQGLARFLLLVALTGLAACVCILGGMNAQQSVSVAAFVMLVSATALFWEFHLAFAFLGISGMLILNILDLASLGTETKLDVIIFLMSMMIIVGVLKDLGLFSWIIIQVLSLPNITGRGLVAVACILGVAMSCLIDEMAAIVFAMALIFQIADALDVRPMPFIIMVVMAINVGSAGTMLGNPVGILIGQNASPPLSFNDFMIWSFPLMLAEFVVILVLMLFLFRKQIAVLNEKLEQRRQSGLALAPMVRVPHTAGLFVLALLLALLILHKLIERHLGLEANTMLITAPLLVSGVLMAWRRGQVRKYLEQDVEWNVVIFLMMLFMIAGALERTQVTDVIAGALDRSVGSNPSLLLPTVLAISAIGSAFIENIVFVAAFMPVVVKLDQTPLIWALLHGACLGGNITMVGSTANIVAVGMLEKRYWTKVHFWMWLKTGLIVGIVSCLISWIGLTILSPHMPTRAERIATELRYDAGASAEESATGR
ncbi:MAG: hypothetical protein LUG50_00590 [Planctomycetaceae bacterium]|nr:hypothetical protein [Planctomycetaceae bacterium]